MLASKRPFTWYLRRACLFVPVCLLVLFLLVSVVNFDTRRTVDAICAAGKWGGTGFCDEKRKQETYFYNEYTDQLVSKYELKHLFLSDMAFRHHASRFGFSTGTNYTLNFPEERCHIYMRGVDEGCVASSKKARRIVFFYDIRSLLYLMTAAAGLVYIAYRLFIRPGRKSSS